MFFKEFDIQQSVAIFLGDDIPVNTKCHSERSEVSREHLRGCASLCPRDSSLHYVPFWMTYSVKKYIITFFYPPACILSPKHMHSPKYAEIFLNQQCGFVNQRRGLVKLHC